MSGVNKVILVGRLGADPETKSTPSGQMVSSLSLATSESWVKDGKKEERTEWHRVVLWGKLAELASRFLKKGRMVYIEGKLQTRSWQDQQGQKRYTTEIVATQMTFIDNTREGPGGYESGADNGQSFAPESSSFQGDFFEGSSSAPKTNTFGGGYNSTAADDDIPF